MATEAGGEATGSLAERAAALIELQVETLVAEGVQTGALAAGRLAHAMRALRAAQLAWSVPTAAEPADPTPAADEGDDDDDDFEPPRDDAEGLELDAIILRGLDRIQARAAADALGAGTAGQAGLVEAVEDRFPRGSDTS